MEIVSNEQVRHSMKLLTPKRKICPQKSPHIVPVIVPKSSREQRLKSFDKRSASNRQRAKGRNCPGVSDAVGDLQGTPHWQITSSAKQVELEICLNLFR